MTKLHRLSLLPCVLAAVLFVGCARDSLSESAGAPVVTPSSEPPLLTLTPKAVAMVRQLSADAGVQDKLYLRVRVVPGGCQGYLHKLDLDPAATAEDHIFETDGVTVVVFQRQAEMLRSARVDYLEKEDQRGFTVDNPNFAGDWTGKWLSLLQQERDVK